MDYGPYNCRATEIGRSTVGNQFVVRFVVRSVQCVIHDHIKLKLDFNERLKKFEIII